VRKRLAPRPEVCQPVEVQAPAGLHALRRTRRTRPLNLRDRTHKLGLRRRLATPRTGMRSPITTALLPFRDRSHAGRFGLQPGLGLAVGRRRRLVGRDLDQLGGLCAQGRRDRTRNARTHTAPIPLPRARVTYTLAGADSWLSEAMATWSEAPTTAPRISGASTSPGCSRTAPTRRCSRRGALEYGAYVWLVSLAPSMKSASSVFRLSPFGESLSSP
jgi:hypothetical protein